MRWSALARTGSGIAIVVAALTPVYAPAALVFPYQRQVGDTRVYSEVPIPDAIGPVLARSDRLLRTSAIFDARGYGRRLFLTSGGWRWRWLSFPANGAMALSRAFTEAVVVNRSDVARDAVRNGAPIAGERSLSGVIAHERTHGLIRRHFGVAADMRYPGWVREGYCDHVAGASTLDDAQAAALVARGQAMPALAYYQARKRVEGALKANGGSVDALFAGAG